MTKQEAALIDKGVEEQVKRVAIEFKKWCEENEGATGYALGRSLTNEELYEFYKNNNFPTENPKK